ncbi:hypothetical protein B0H14DRAFT_3567806 [Mycena olivaceomarginata]|nr:hypothetical protein B0H14DRAFT_3567806 [Mycena olivaceomarginata]
MHPPIVASAPFASDSRAFHPACPLRSTITIALSLCSSSSLHTPPTIPTHPPFTMLPRSAPSAPRSSTLALSPPPITPTVLISPDERSPVIASTWCCTWEAGPGEIAADASCADEEAGGHHVAVGALAAVGGGTEQKGKAVLEPEEEEDSAKEREVGPAPMQGLSPRGCWSGAARE